MNARHVTGIKVACLAALALSYVQGLPDSVQGLDTGELVAGAYNFTVVHPPGYPLYVCLHHIATHLPLGDSVFFRAALMTCVCAIGTLAVIAFAQRMSVSIFVMLVVPLAAQSIFWRYALLPDVFMLNALFAASLMCLALFAAPGVRRTWLLALVWGIGLANHQTLILLAPLVLYAMLQGCPRRTMGSALLAGVIACALLYALLFAMHPRALTSWGDIHTASDWARHVLRREYGTLRLARTDADGSAWRNCAAFASMALQSMPVALGLVGLGCVWGRARVDRVYWFAWFAVVGSTLLFLWLANVGEGPVLERFFLMPLVGITVLAIPIARVLPSRLHMVLAAGAIVVSVGHLLSDLPERNFAGDTIVEDYAKNLLVMASTKRNAVLLAEGDTAINALRYVQHVQHVHSEIPVISTTGLPAWRVPQLMHMHPALTVQHSDERGIGTARLMSDIVIPNQPAVTFFANATHGLDTSKQRTTYLGLGRRLEPGTGQSFDAATFEAIEVHSTPARFSPRETVIEPKVLYAAYAMGDLLAGKLSSDPQVKRQHFARALQRVPYCWPALYELCLLDGRTNADCRSAAQRLRTSDANYF